jgi:hypothetical protein
LIEPLAPTAPRRTRGAACLATAAAAFASPLAIAQEMEPRAYVPAPTGLNFAQVTLARSTGGIAVDPSLPLDNVDARINVATLGYLRTFALFGQTASIGGGVPYAWGEVSGDVFESRKEVTRSGIGDARVRLAVNLLGGPALDRAGFARRKQTATLGASVTVVVPTGQYDPERLVNIGSNRWAVKPEIGWYQPIGAWTFELAGGAWFFEDNDDFFGGQRREQAPLASFQTHVSYSFRRNLWLAGDLTWYSGGRTTVDGRRMADRQDSSRAGVTLSVPFARNYSVKMTWADGVSSRIGSDFTTYAITLQRAW